MRRKTTVCVDREREFQIDELFFSTTDLRGVIRSGNDVFVRVSGYDEADLIGHPHSKIRHPDMPASVFRVFWDVLQAGDSIAAYVKNRAKDGEYYWVMAVATPITDGYLSVRLKPTSDLLPTVVDVYRRVVRDEQAASDDGLSKDAIVEIGLASLHNEISSLGFMDYAAFMQHALAVETASRQEKLPNALPPLQLTPKQRLDATERERDISDLAVDNAQCDVWFGEMLSGLATLSDANRKFIKACDAMGEQSESVSMIAINASVCASTDTLHAIAGELSAAEKDNQQLIAAMTDSVNRISRSLSGLAYNLSVAALQGEIGTHFLRELSCGDSSSSQAQLQLLLSQADKGSRRLFDQLDQASDWFGEIAGLTERLHRNAKTLRFIRMAGVTESTCLPAGHAFAGLFDEVKSNIASITSTCTTLRCSVKECQTTIASIGGQRTKLADSLSRISSHSDAFVFIS